MYVKVKSLLIAILGLITAWVILGLITKSFNYDILIGLLFGTFLGYRVAKQEKKVNT